jgi:hypothetical protein
MSEELINVEIENANKEKIEKLKIALTNLKEKKSKILFCVPESQSPANLSVK